MTEKIIKDGVNVKECIYLNPFKEYECFLYASTSSEPFCEGTNCYYKQLQRKTAECEKLQKHIDIKDTELLNQEKIINRLIKQKDILTEALEEIKDYRLCEMGETEEYYNEVAPKDEDEQDTIIDTANEALERIKE